MAVEAVKNGAGECLVRAVYAPNVAEPLDVQVEINGGAADLKLWNKEFVLRQQDGCSQASLPFRLHLTVEGMAA